MSREKLIIGGGVLLVLLGLLVYKQAKHDESIGKPVTAATEMPSISPSEDPDKISITNGDKPEVVLQEVPDPNPSASAGTDGGPAMMWTMTKPLNADANQQAVKDLLANIKELKIDSKITLILDDDTKKQKQLDAAHAVHVIAWKGADKKLDALFGKSGSAGELAILSDKPKDVWAVKGYSSYLYTKETKDFRNKDVLRFDDAKASQVAITNSHGTFTFTKEGDKWVGTSGKKAIERFDQEKVKDMLRAYKLLSAEDFGDGKSAADTGLDKPDAEVTIHMNGEKDLELAVGKVSSGNNRWAKRDGADTIYQITNYASDWVTSDATKYQAAADAGAPDSGAKTAVAQAGKKK